MHFVPEISTGKIVYEKIACGVRQCKLFHRLPDRPVHHKAPPRLVFARLLQRQVIAAQGEATLHGEGDGVGQPRADQIERHAQQRRRRGVTWPGRRTSPRRTFGGQLHDLADHQDVEEQGGQRSDAEKKQLDQPGPDEQEGGAVHALSVVADLEALVVRPDVGLQVRIQIDFLIQYVKWPGGIM